MGRIYIKKKDSVLKSSLVYCPGKVYLLNGIPDKLTLCIMESLCLGARNTTLLTTDCNLSMQKAVEQKNISVKFINAFSNPFGDPVKELLAANSGEMELLIINSLTTLTIVADFARTLSLLSRLSKVKVMVVAVIHPECHSEDELSEIQYMADCSFASTGISSPNKVRVQWRKPSGKITNQVESYTLDVNGKLASSTVITKEEQKVAEKPIPLSTFRLELSDKELDDRKQLVLPYVKAQDGVGSRGSDRQTGRIIYEPDAGDDFDEEDPDDDLTL